MKVNTGVKAFHAILLAVASSCWAGTLPPSCGDEKTVIEVSTHKHGPAPVPPQPGTAKAVFIEVADKNALPVTTRVAIDGTWLGANKENSYFESPLLPGEHHVCADWQLNRRFIRDYPGFDLFTAEAGKTYYFLIKVSWNRNVEPVQVTRYDGSMSLDLSRVNEDQGQYLVQNSKLSIFAFKK